MVRKQIRDLRDLARAKYWLKAECQACGHKALIDPGGLRREFMERRWQTDLETVERRLRCSQCESKSIYVGPGFAPGMRRDG